MLKYFYLKIRKDFVIIDKERFTENRDLRFESSTVDIFFASIYYLFYLTKQLYNQYYSLEVESNIEFVTLSCIEINSEYYNRYTAVETLSFLISSIFSEY